ncbi:MAG: hypothetical protein ACWA41_12920 [Putridiphycobacter sp.]
MRDLQKIIGLIIFLFGISACAIFKGKGSLSEIKITYNPNAEINYGKRLPIDVVAHFSNGKTKTVTTKKETTVYVTGAKYQNGQVYLPLVSKQIKEESIYVQASYTFKDKIYKDSVLIPYNFRGAVTLNFSGLTGEKGMTGENGKTPLLFKNGTDGGKGLIGGHGKVGDDLQVYIWKENAFYYIKVYNMTSEKTYFYTASGNTNLYTFKTNGGAGGTGGTGGEGGDGKNAESALGKNKVAGNGGDGGDGGNGGDGGKGGSVYVFIHSNATDFQNKINVVNSGGAGGRAGAGGSGGKAGKVLEGQTAKSAGAAGNPGLQGLPGENGDIISIEVVNFDINDIKKTN